MNKEWNKFKEGETVILDDEYNNSLLVTVVSQSIPSQMFTLVKDENYEWEVMTNRLKRE